MCLSLIELAIGRDIADHETLVGADIQLYAVVQLQAYGARDNRIKQN